MTNIPIFISDTFIEAFDIINKVKEFLGIYEEGKYSVISEYFDTDRLVEFEKIMKDCSEMKVDDILIEEICWETSRLVEIIDHNFVLTDIGLLFKVVI